MFYRHNCTCATYFKGGMFRDGIGVPSISLPHGLQNLTYRLVEARQGAARFVPASVEEVLHATYTFWNLLDAMMHQLAVSNNYQTGYIRELQLQRMVQLVRQPSVQTYCEIGFNGGHSASAMLFANPTLTVHSFDLMSWSYSNATASLVETQFGRRFVLHRGDSRVEVPLWTSQQPNACDVLFIDGAHDPHGAYADMRNMRAAAAPNAICLADDITSGAGEALVSMRRHMLADLLESYGPFEAPSVHNPCMRTARRGPYCVPWGFAVFTYTNRSRRQRAG